MIPIDSKIKKPKTKLATPNSEEEDDEEEDEVNDDDDDDGVEVESISETNSDENNNNDNDLDELTVNKLTFDKIKVKLCDFSFSQVITGNSKILGMMGTVAYSAPEVLEYEQLTKATDMWSLGVLIHVLLSSYTPFGNGNTRDCSTQTNILNTRGERFECDESCFENLSKECRKLIEELLVYRPK
jgi:serine/threonine protein kinase